MDFGAGLVAVQAKPVLQAPPGIDLRAVDQPDGLAEVTACAAVQTGQQALEKVNKKFGRARLVGIGEGGAGRRLATEQAQGTTAGCKARHGLAQAMQPAQGGAEHGDEMIPAVEVACMLVSIVALDQPAEIGPRNRL